MKKVKANSTKKSLVASGISLLLCVALLVGTTFAWFTDSVTNKGNKIQAGNLQVELNEFKDDAYTPVSTDPIFNYDKWEPGYTDVHAFQIKNSGTLALKYQLDIIKQGENDTNNVNIADVIDVYVDLDNNAISELPKNLDGMTKIGTLSEVLAGENGAAKGHLSAGQSDYAVIALKMQETAGNDYQNASLGATFDIVLNAAQYTEEKDGFGNTDYDAGATYPVSDETEFKDAVKNAQDGDTIAVTGNIVLNSQLVITKNLTIEGNDNSVISNNAVVISGSSVTFKNVTFSKPTSISKNASNVRLEGTTEEAVFEGCTFVDPQWESIQVTSKSIKNVVINNCTFSAAHVDGKHNGSYNNAEDQAIRFIHFEPATAVVNVQITNNTFKNCDKVADSVVAMYNIAGSSLTIGNNKFEGEFTNANGGPTSMFSIGWPEDTRLQDKPAWEGKIQTFKIAR